MLSNLLQELALARDYGRKRIVLDEARLTENPVDRLSRMIKNSFWNSLTRRIDGDGLEIICADPKNRSDQLGVLSSGSEGSELNADLICTVVIQDEQRQAFDLRTSWRAGDGRVLPRSVSRVRQVPLVRPSLICLCVPSPLSSSRAKPHLGLQVEMLPPNPSDPAFVKSLNDRPGILALAMKKTADPLTGKKTFKGIPFVVPGARFNELYNWDSYFISLGLLVDGKTEMAKGMVEHFIFEIKHYGQSSLLCLT